MAKMFDRKPTKLFSRSDSRTREENLRLSAQAGEEIEELLRQGKITERAIRCASCNRVVLTAYSDCTSGHMTVVCKCGIISLINLGTFKTKRIYNDDDIDIDF